jgi:cell division protein FtsA
MKDLGTVVIDIGKNQTSYSIYEEWVPLYYWILPIGAENITRDISIGMQIDIKEAEKLKINYGSLNHWEVYIEESEDIDTHFLANIITARYEEIFEKIQKKLIELDKDGRLAGWILMSGGAAKIEHLTSLAKDIFKVATFYASDKNKTTTDLMHNLQFINTLWLYTWSEKYSWNRKGTFNLWLQNDLFKKIGQFIRNIF